MPPTVNEILSERMECLFNNLNIKKFNVGVSLGTDQKKISRKLLNMKKTSAGKKKISSSLSFRLEHFIEGEF